MRRNTTPDRSVTTIDAACRGVAGVYQVPAGVTAPRFLARLATELWRFGCVNRIMDPPDGCWVTLTLRARGTSSGAAPVVIGPALVGALTPARRKQWSERLEREHTEGKERMGTVGPMLRVILDDRLGGKAALTGGLIWAMDSGSGRADAATGALFAALAEAAGRRIVVPRARQAAIMARLTPMPRRVLPLVMEGLTTREIGERIDRSPHTAHDHVMSIFRTLGVGSRKELESLWNGEATSPPPSAAKGGRGRAVVVEVKVGTPALLRR